MLIGQSLTCVCVVFLISSQVYLREREIYILYPEPQKTLSQNDQPEIYRGYYTVARRYEFYVRVEEQYLTSE